MSGAAGEHTPTPGPWVASTDGVFVEVEQPYGMMAVAVTCGYSVAHGNSRFANARLIAAAPELLEASANWIAWLDSDGWREDAADYETQLLAAMRAAIVKARGA